MGGVAPRLCCRRGGIVPGTGLPHLLDEIEHHLYREGIVQEIGVRLAQPPNDQCPLRLIQNVWYARDPALRYVRPLEDVPRHLDHPIVGGTGPVRRGGYLDLDLHLVVIAQTTSGEVTAGRGTDPMSGPGRPPPGVDPAHPSGRQLEDVVHPHRSGLHLRLDAATPDLPAQGHLEAQGLLPEREEGLVHRQAEGLADHTHPLWSQADLAPALRRASL